MRTERSSFIRFVAAGCAILSCACGTNTLETVDYQRTSPDQQWTVQVITYEPIPYSQQRLKVTLTGKSISRLLFVDEKSDVAVCFAEIAWSVDSSLVGVVIRNCYGRTATIIGYDAVKQAAMKASDVEDLLRKEISRNYPDWKRYRWGRDLALTDTPDPIQYATTDEAQAAFIVRRRQH